MTCKDCVHYDICEKLRPIEYCMDITCSHFKNKANFVELPCKVGDTLWVVWSYTKAQQKKVYPVEVYALRYDNKKNNMRVCVEGDFKIDCYDGYYTHRYQGTFSWENIGKTVFLTKEEAEQKLKGGVQE